MATEKERWADDFHGCMMQLSKVMVMAPEVVGAYFDNTYNSGGGDELVDADLSGAFNFSAADASSGITLLQQFINFLQNDDVTKGDYASTLNKLRYGRK